MRRGAESETIASVVAVAIIAQQIAAKVARDVLFLSSLPPSALPGTVAAAAGLSFAAVLLTSRLLGRFGLQRVAPWLFVVNGGGYVLAWLLFPYAGAPVAVALYLQTVTLGGLVISGFWSVINELFDPHRARGAVARLTTGATLGGLLGGLLAGRLGQWLGPSAILVALAVVNFACAGGIRELVRPLPPAPRSMETNLGGTAIIRGSGYLRRIAVLSVTIAGMEALLEFALKARAVETFSDQARLTDFFSNFYSATALFAFLVQLGFAKLSLARLGLAGSLALGPLLVAATGGGAALLPGLVGLTIATGLEHVFANSLFRSAYELLYTPVPPEQKRPVKVVLDVALGRLGAILGSGLIGVLGLLVWPLEISTTIAAALLAAGAGFGCLRLHRHYMGELAQSLKAGAVKLRDEDLLDRTTRYTLATTMAIDRGQLLERIAERVASDAPGPAPLQAVQDRASSADVAFVARIEAGDREGIIDQLLSQPLSPARAAFTLPLLDSKDPQLDEAVKFALRGALPAVVGQLTDLLLDDHSPLPRRIAVAKLLGDAADPRAAAALQAAIQGGPFDLRFWAARTLSGMLERSIAKVDPDACLAAVRAELARDDSEWVRIGRLESDLRVPAIHRGLEHVFNLLSLVFERTAVIAALAALSGTEARLRGTALEYIETSFPRDVSERILERIEGPLERGPPTGRPAGAAARELRESYDQLAVDWTQLEGR